MITFLLIALAAFASAVIHGATGMAGGIILAAITSHIMGVKQAIPLVAIALVFSHASRAYFNRQHIDWPLVKLMVLSSAPTIALGTITFIYLPATAIALTMAFVLSLSFPVKAYAKKHNFKTSRAVLGIASSVWGFLAGNVIGPGFVLVPFILGTGISRMTFVASLAVLVLAMNIIKLTVFGWADVIDQELLLFGVVVGLITIPANWLGQKVLHSISDHDHDTIINWMTVAVILNFLYLASRA